MSDEQRSLFDPDERDHGRSGVAMARAALAGIPPDGADGFATREEAIERVARNNEQWIEHVALPFIRSYLTQHHTLFVDDLWKSGLERPAEPKALGAAIRKAAARGWMAQNGDFRRSEGNANPKPVWASRIYGEEYEHG